MQKKSQSGETFPFRIVGHEVEQAFIHRSRFGLAGILLQFRSHFKVYDRTKVWKSNELGGELQCKSLDRAPPIAACFLQAYDGSCLTDIESIAGSVGESCSKLSDENRRVLSNLFLPPVSNHSDFGPNDHSSFSTSQPMSSPLPRFPHSGNLPPQLSRCPMSSPLQVSSRRLHSSAGPSTKASASPKLNFTLSPAVYAGTNRQAVDPKSPDISESKEDDEAQEESNPALGYLASSSVENFQNTAKSRQQLLDTMTPPRYNTRSCQPCNPIELPGETSPDCGLAPPTNGHDSEIVLVWPFEDDRYSSSVAITNGDLKRLGDGEFLNDTLIEFGLKWELSEIEKRNPELVSSIHLFNSFFFQKLSGNKSGPKLSPAEEAKEAYAGVRKWTKGLDVFKKDYLVIPINEHMHWYFIIVSNPGKLLEPSVQNHQTDLITPFRTPVRPRRSQKFYSTDKSAAKQISLAPEEVDYRLVTSSYFDNSKPKTCTLSVEEIDGTNEKEVDDSKAIINAAVDNSTEALEHMELDEKSLSTNEATYPQASSEEIRDDMELPYVLTLDSLGSSHRPQSLTILRYLINEAEDKLHQTLPENLTKTVNVKKVPVPEQPNYCDCGLYLIHAFKTFFGKPTSMLRWILDNTRKRSSEQWQNEIHAAWNAAGAAQARQALRDQLHTLIPQYQEKVRLRKAADEDKKSEQARIRKFSSSEVSLSPEIEASKKPRLSCSEDGQVSLLPAPTNQSASKSMASNRFLQKSSDTGAQKDELHTPHNSQSKTLTLSAGRIDCHKATAVSLDSFTPVRDRSDRFFSKSEIGNNAQTDLNIPKDAEMRDSSRSPTPDIDLMIKCIIPPSTIPTGRMSPPFTQSRSLNRAPRSLPYGAANPSRTHPTDEFFCQRNLKTYILEGGTPLDPGSTLPQNSDYDGESSEDDDVSTTPDANAAGPCPTVASATCVQESKTSVRSKKKRQKERISAFHIRPSDHDHTPSTSMISGKHDHKLVRSNKGKKSTRTRTSSIDSSYQRQTSDNPSRSSLHTSDHHPSPIACNWTTHNEGNSENPLMVDD